MKKTVKNPELLIDSHHGIYIPKLFYDNFDFEQFGLKKSDYSDLNNPDNEYYWETWDDLLNNAETKEGHILQQDQDLWLTEKNYEFEY